MSVTPGLVQVNTCHMPPRSCRWPSVGASANRQASTTPSPRTDSITTLLLPPPPCIGADKPEMRSVWRGPGTDCCPAYPTPDCLPRVASIPLVGTRLRTSAVVSFAR